MLLTTERPPNSRVAHLLPTNEQEAEIIVRGLNIHVEFEVVSSLKGGPLPPLTKLTIFGNFV